MRAYIIASILIILGLSSIAYKGSLEVGNWMIPYLGDVSSALLVGGLLSLLFKIFQDKESESTLRRLLRIHDSVDELGLREILPEVQSYSYTNIIANSDNLSIVMNDGLRWIGNNTVHLQDRFSKKTETEFFLVDPDSSFVKCLAEKTSGTEDDLKRKIKDSWQRIEDAYGNSSKKGRVKVYRIKSYPTKSMFFTEDSLIETPYQTASGRASIPVFIYAKVARQDAPYYFAKHDIDAMRAEAKLEKEFKS